MGVTPTVAPPTHMELTPHPDSGQDDKKVDDDDDPLAEDENDDPARFDDAWEREDDPDTLPLKKKRRKK